MSDPLAAERAELAREREALAAERAALASTTTVDDVAEEPTKPAKEKGLLHYLGLGLSGGLLAVMLLLAVLVIVAPMAVGGQALTVLTSSMEPQYPAGTLVIVKPVKAADVKIGDVVTYQLESGKDAVVTHRVIARTQNVDTGKITFTTKGDNNDDADLKPVSEVQIRGTLWYAIPYLGWVNNWVNGDMRVFIVPVIVGGLFLYALWMVVSSIRDRAKRKAGRSA
ncbi:MAG TPA: signal peptidase I [Pseudolysinimonas sp.]|nr:signal peptidase I [Pseudolysinimonas sp.]